MIHDPPLALGGSWSDLFCTRRWPEGDRKQRRQQRRNEDAVRDVQRGGHTSTTPGVPEPDLGDGEERDEDAEAERGTAKFTTTDADD